MKGKELKKKRKGYKVVGRKHTNFKKEKVQEDVKVGYKKIKRNR